MAAVAAAAPPELSTSKMPAAAATPCNRAMVRSEPRLPSATPGNRTAKLPGEAAPMVRSEPRVPSAVLSGRLLSPLLSTLRSRMRSGRLLSALLSRAVLSARCC